MIVSVLTPSLPTRAAMLAEAKASVLAQTWPDVEHLIGVDDHAEGAGTVLNRLLSLADGDWCMVLDDDDLLDPSHIARAMEHTGRADVIYALPRVTGGTFGNYHRPFDPDLLRSGYNCVSHTALMRTEMVRAVCGWPNVRGFDLAMFQQLLDAGARFMQVPAETWTYRLHGSNWSRGTLTEAAPL